ncbi:MAG: D-alanyl-D-alanine carboxypeptidase/D-alanyl-D-alanine-endopeptidase [Mediterranea sp.]|jgi:D-alanyl-D-alanine carboxypeptidase/D-alanyl-D-alanine-endopeptidase (penicillin-binding protein 4)|nr:D-alanyl-D-alanine carboxypeptidase/D-alanyl-D-alanine-endopeptidase [Mediterranea sp.]
MKSWLIGLLLLPATLWGQNHSTLADRLDTLVANELPAGSNVGIAVYDLTDNKPLYNHQADKLCRPASTMKLLTGIAALAQPESDAPFRTEVWYKGTIERDTLHGDLYVVGGFDPEFTDEALDTLVSYVQRLPFSVVNGHIYGDVSMRDSTASYWGSGWIWDDNPSAFQPYLSPLMLNKGTVTVTVTPTVAGEVGTVVCVPRSTYYIMDNRTQSYTPSAGGLKLTRSWQYNLNNLSLTGNVTAKWSGGINLFLSDDFFMHTFVERLEEAGVQCPHRYSFGVFTRDSLATPVVYYETPMQQALDQMLKESDNLNAEAFLCRLGVQTTGRRYIKPADGIKAIDRLMTRMGENPKRYRIVDGSGLSQYDYLSPQLLVAFLRFAYADTNIFQRLYKALPIAGVDGTLQHRMKNSPAYRRVYAKTGTMTGVSCLAGYLRAANGHFLTFAIMNQNQLSGSAARKFQDKVCELLAESGEL